MERLWNFIIGNKLITVVDKCEKQAEQAAHRIYEELQKDAG